jgi:hypothetical protein
MTEATQLTCHCVQANPSGSESIRESSCDDCNLDVIIIEAFHLVHSPFPGPVIITFHRTVRYTCSETELEAKTRP